MTEDEVFPPLFREALAHALVDIRSEGVPDSYELLPLARTLVQRVVSDHRAAPHAKPAEGNWPHPDVWYEISRHLTVNDRVALQRALMTHMALLAYEEKTHD